MLDVSLEAEIRTIIYDDYGVGHQNIESREIYDKLIRKGVDVPECAEREEMIRFDRYPGEAAVCPHDQIRSASQPGSQCLPPLSLFCNSTRRFTRPSQLMSWSR